MISTSNVAWKGDRQASVSRKTLRRVSPGSMSTSLIRTFRSSRISGSICGISLIVLCLLVVSAHPSEGRTTTAWTLLGDTLFGPPRVNLASLSTRRTVNITELNCTRYDDGGSFSVVCDDGQTYIQEAAKDEPGSGAFFRDLILCVLFVLTAGTSSHSLDTSILNHFPSKSIPFPSSFGQQS